MADRTFTLNDGNTIPALGLGALSLLPLISAPPFTLQFTPPGTWQSAPGEVKAAVSYALQNGYKLVDGAYGYSNEDEVGQGIKEALDAGIKREDIFVVSKVWNTYNTRVELGLDKSLKALGLDYVDLFLVVSWALVSDVGEERVEAESLRTALAAVDEPRRCVRGLVERVK
jgi:glycerol 2-dehydrogenase (NADP+)/D-galacturonate reductase